MVAHQRILGRPALEVLAEALPGWVSRLHFPRSMRWNGSGTAFSRPVRWILALLGETAVPFAYAGVESGRSRRPRPLPAHLLLPWPLQATTTLHWNLHGVPIPLSASRDSPASRLVAAEVGGQIAVDADLLEEVANLVEVPTAILGSFEEHYLDLPQDVLIAVMKKHQRYFPVFDAQGKIMPHFVTIRNGAREHTDLVRQATKT